MKTNKFFQLLTLAICAVTFAFVTGCEGPAGPMGPAGADGTDGTNGINGVDANETCKECHSPNSVDLIAVQFAFSKHEYGEAAFEEAGNTGCTPCHGQEAFKDVVARNVPATFTLNASTGKYVNDYITSTSTAYGELGCSTCHSEIHNSYTSSDLPSLTTVAPVPLTMWGAAKTINLTQDAGNSNLCVKCHQPRPLTQSAGNGNVLDYANLVANPTAIFYSKADPGVDVLVPGYRTHVHYGSVGAVFAGVGAIEFTGPVAYGNSPHATQASCQDCHMAPMNGRAGEHTFSAIGNYIGCNVTGCHSDSPLSATSGKVTNAKSDNKMKLDALAAKLKVGGIDIMNRNPDTESNLWASATTNKYDGYLNVYDPINNPNGLTNNPGGTFKNNGNVSSWSQAQKDQNNLLPELTLTNAQMGAIINFQMCLREFSKGIHNTDYSNALLDNSVAILP